MNFFENPYIVQNLSRVGSLVLTAFLIAFFLTPFLGKLAIKIGAVDLPAWMRRKTERGISTRIHEYVYPKLGGLSVVISILATIALTVGFTQISKGIIVGILIITFTGFLDDKFDLPSRVQVIGHLLAAFVLVLSGITITNINLLGLELDFSWLSGAINILGYTYNFNLPADILTVLWITGMINVINWVGGVDALNGSITSIALITLMLFSLASGNILLASFIGIHLGAVLGVLPFNYPPGKIMYGSIGDYLNGYLLALFAILGSTKWTAALIVLAMPIIDGILVVYMRIKSHKGILKTPLKILQISDKNHLHHRLLDAGYSKKTVTLVETAMMVFVCTVAIFFSSNIRSDALALIVGVSSIFVFFAVIFFLKKRHERNEARKSPLPEPKEKEVVIKTIEKPEEEDKEKFIY